jgi:hypothetical protein
VSSPDLTPPIHDADIPPFHQLDWPRFERLAVDLFQEEEGVSYAVLHGMPGPATDHGADVLAFRKDGSVEIGSCKRYEETTPALLAKWSGEFLKYWSTRWSGMRVVRFVLVTSATNLARIEIVDQVASEQKRFAALGVRYEVWGPPQLVRKLRPHRRIAAAYLKEHWADAICGPMLRTGDPLTAPAATLNAAVVAQLSDLQTLFAEEVGNRAQASLDDLRRGDFAAVESFVAEQRREPRWSQLGGKAQATVLRLAGSSALTAGDIGRARELSDAADACSPPDEPRLAARITAERDGPEAGLAMLGEAVSPAGRQLRAAFLLSAGRRAEALDLLLDLDRELPSDPETIRLLSLERLGAGDRAAALQLITETERLAGSWTATLRTGVVVRYAQSVSQALPSEWLLAPNPLDSDLVRTGPEVEANLSEALVRLDRLPDAARSADDELWRLAVLSNMEGRRNEAASLANRLLLQNPANPTAVAWTLMRSFEIDLAPSRSALEQRYQVGADLATVRVLGMLMASEDGGPQAADFLDVHADKQGSEERAEASIWAARLRGEPSDKSEEALRRAKDDNDWADADKLLDDCLQREPPRPFGIVLAQRMAVAGRWEPLARNLNALLKFDTPTGIRLAAHAAANAGDHGRVLQIIQDAESIFGRTLPADMRRLKADALSRGGRFRDALQEVAARGEPGDLADALFEAELRARVGSVRQSAPVIRRALGEDALSPQAALGWSQRFSQVAPDLSRELLRAAVGRDLDDAHAMAALGQAFDLGMTGEADHLMPVLVRKAQAGDPGTWSLHVDELDGFLRSQRESQEHRDALYRTGAVPVHIYVRGQADELLRLFVANPEFDSHTPLEGRLVRHGGRPADLEVAEPFTRWRIHLDVTGLLEVHRVGLLDRLEAHPHGITVSSHLPAVLQQMQASRRATRIEVAAAVRSAIEAVRGGLVEAREWIAPEVRRIIADGEGGPSGSSLPTYLAGLAKAGAIDAAEAARAGAAEGDFTVDPAEPVVLSGPTLVALSTSGLLARLAGTVPMLVHQDVLDGLAGEVAAAEAASALAAQAADLSHRVGEGILSGVYRVLPPSEPDDGTESEEGEEDGPPFTLIERALTDLLRAAPLEGGMVWFDDRNLTGYIHSGGMPIVGTLDAVRAMERSGAISADEAGTVRRKLRASGAVFLSFEVGEVIEQLLRAPVLAGRLVETTELRELRRAFAATRLLEADLKVGPSSDLLKDRPDEDVVARSLLRLFADGLEAIWTNRRDSIEAQLARSDWLMGTFRIHRLLREPSDEPDAVRFAFEAMEIGLCLDKAWEIGGERDQHRDTRLQFLNWCWQRMMVPRLGARPDVVDAVADYLVRFYGGLIRAGLPGRPGEDVMYERLLYLRVQRLPEPITERIGLSGIFARHVRLGTSVTLKGHRIEAGRFWRAARTAARYGRARTRTTRGKRINFRRTPDAILISGAVRVRIDAGIANVMAARSSGRSEAVAAFLERLDLAAADAERFAARATVENGVIGTSKLLREAEEASVATRRQEVENSLRERRGTSLSLLEPPPHDRLQHHYRLANEDAGPAAAWRALSNKRGPVAAYLMLSAYPAALPDAASVPDDAVPEIVRRARTPMALAVAGELIRARGGTDQELASAAARLVASIESLGEAFGAILRWTHARTMSHPGWYRDDPARALALTWLHSDWMLDAFARHGLDAADISQTFAVNSAGLDLVARAALSPSGPVDQAAPVFISTAVLGYHGLAAVLGDRDCRELLEPELMARVHGLLVRGVGGGVVEPDLLLRRADMPDALGGFMRRSPVGVLGGQDPRSMRDLIIDDALERVRAAPDDIEGWVGLVAVSNRGLSANHLACFETCVDAADLFALASFGAHDVGRTVWRGVLGTLAWGGRDISERLAALARRCSRHFPGQIRPDGAAETALRELVEAVVRAARPSTGVIDENLACGLLWRIALAWPASTAYLRSMATVLTDEMPPHREDHLWRLAINLNRLP